VGRPAPAPPERRAQPRPLRFRASDARALRTHPRAKARAWVEWPCRAGPSSRNQAVDHSRGRRM